ncbi:MAG: hypothetical protein IBX61_08225 [Thermoleophilia bacterium]|nr:hypothetical protein [Thermoleophilia bacterium]
MPAISSLYIYAEPRCRKIDFDEIAGYAKKRLKRVDVRLRGPLMESSIDGDGPAAGAVSADVLARGLAAAKVRRLDAPRDLDSKALPGEETYESRRLASRDSPVFGILYDGFELASLLSGLLPAGECRIDRLHVVFTNQLIGTWEEGDLRYHARAAILGAPSIISVSGIVEAPARDRAYYITRRNAEALGFSEDEKVELSRSFAEDFLSHDDVRLTEAAKGYLMQAAAYRMTDEPFCKDPECRLYNAHWQRELLKAQFGGPEFCGWHRRLFNC